MLPAYQNKYEIFKTFSIKEKQDIQKSQNRNESNVLPPGVSALLFPSQKVQASYIVIICIVDCNFTVSK